MTGKGNSTSPQEFTYFGSQASWGVTKHMGGLKATAALAELCHVNRDTRLLEVGCGVGLTTCHLAARYGCQIVAVDLSAEMVSWASRRAQRKGLQERIEFRIADAQDLPFAEGMFDVVMCESVTAFPADQQKAVSEYARVTRPGGYVGMNEGTWIQTPPPAELVAFMERTMAGARFHTVAEWKALLEGAGLQGIIAQPQQMSAMRQRLDEMAGLDWQDWKDRLRALSTFFRMLGNPRFRQYAKEITPSWAMIRNLFRYLGYGYYVGRKG